MTSDYVHYVLGLQGWERAINEDSYMAGEEDYLDEGQVPCHTEEVSNTVCFCETGCQTPSEWSDSGLAQKAEDAPPQLAPTRYWCSSGQVRCGPTRSNAPRSFPVIP